MRGLTMTAHVRAGLCLLLLSACSAEPGPATAATDSLQSQTGSAFLFVQQASSGALALGRDTMPDVLVLFGVDDATTWFTDRPRRDAGVMTTSAFLAAWGLGTDSFREDPPNAALVLESDSGLRTVFAIEVFNPQYDSATGTLAYHIRPLAGNPPVLLTGSQRHVRESPAQFRNVSLFIDPDENWCLFAYGESCESAYCDARYPLIFDKDKCQAEGQPPAPTWGPPPTCPAGQTAIKYAQGGWGCVTPSPPVPITCPQGCTPVAPFAPGPSPISEWRCASGGFGISFCGMGTPNP